MLLKVLHETSYSYDAPVRYGLLQLRLTPSNGRGQEIREWETDINGGKKEMTSRDHFGNAVDLVRLSEDADSVIIKSVGLVRTSDTAGVVGEHYGLVPLWLFIRPTDRTTPGPGIRELVQELREYGDVQGGRQGLRCSPASGFGTDSGSNLLRTRTDRLVNHRRRRVVIGTRRLPGPLPRISRGDPQPGNPGPVRKRLPVYRIRR